MAKDDLEIGDEVIINGEGLQQLFEILSREGYRIFGPTIHHTALVYDQIRSVSDLPVGWRDVQEAGTYRLVKEDTESLFGYVLGPQSWKKYLHPPVVRLWRAEREGGGFHVVEEKYQIPQYAFLGVRSCEIHAIYSLDSVFGTQEFSDPIYNERRKKVFILAVNCTRPGGTCFCVSMNTGPEVKSGFDIALTEVLDNGRHYFIAEVGTEKGTNVLRDVTCRNPNEEEKRTARALLKEAARLMGRNLDTSNLKSIFYENFEHHQWEKVAERCLTCANCTMVCPTCFCNTIADANTLNGEHAERWRRWDSCFTLDFSYIHGGSIRTSEKSRYRQWLTHKLITWKEQFGTLGCVGCGRCITWCPVGIDITEEARTILEEPSSPVK
ncbi:MAG: cytochrome C [Nitrospira bacterium SG8_3]|nr:MAG: cytochrome C [Nitrospira bacterium SG8_3]